MCLESRLERSSNVVAISGSGFDSCVVEQSNNGHANREDH